jgi:hypothetical protein
VGWGGGWGAGGWAWAAGAWRAVDAAQVEPRRTERLRIP